jgi:hypothetical protein
MLMFLTGILLSPFIFWPIMLVLFCLLILSAEKDSISGGFWVAVFATALGILNFGSFDAALMAVKANPGIVGACIVGYFIVGICWAYFKWYLYVTDFATRIRTRIDANGKEATAQYYANGWGGSPSREEDVKTIITTDFACLAPNVKDFKHKITAWITLWVPSAIWFVLNDPIRRIGNAIYEKLKASFQGISDKVFKSAFKI